MDFFRLETAYDKCGNSPWDAVWYDGDDEDLDALSGSMRLAAIWKPVPVRIETRVRRPDIFTFGIYFALSKKASGLLRSLTADCAELLPLKDPGKRELSVLHPLARTDLAQDAVFRPNKLGANFTVVERYSFVKEVLDPGMHVFQVRQAHGSPARDAGCAFSAVFVSSEFKDLCETNGIQGIAFKSL